MRRLAFTMPDFTRLSWVSDRAADVWQPRMLRIGAAWAEIEWQSILAGVRRCAITVLSPEQYIEAAARWLKCGLCSLPIEVQGCGNYSYAATGVAPVHGQPIGLRLAVGRPESLREFNAAYGEGDEEAIGRLLGYPSCCTRFFRQTWVEQRLIDTTWPMAVATVVATDDAESIDTDGPIEANILWRWMGIRAVPHLPCRFTCEETVDFGQKMIQVGKETGFREEMQWMTEMLSWPVEWSALHGIAEIQTPVVRVSTRTDATPIKYTVRRLSPAYPAEGAHGLGFPYCCRKVSGLPATLEPRCVQSAAAVAQPTSARWYYEDNGFSSLAAMQAAHAPIVLLAQRTLAGVAGRVLDLGCGNGALLREICRTNPQLEPCGVDLSADAIAHAVELLTGHGQGEFRQGDLLQCEPLLRDDGRYALVLLMPGRLLETSPETAARFRDWLQKHAERILVYAYDDWATRYGNLAGLAAATGFVLLGDSAATASLAGLG